MIWDSARGELLRTLTGHKSNVNSLAFGNNNILFSGSSDSKIKVYKNRRR